MDRSLKRWGWAVLAVAVGCATGTQTNEDSDESGGDDESTTSSGAGANGPTGTSSATGAGGGGGAGGAGGGGSLDCAVGETKPCFEGDPALAGVGACKSGEQTCVLTQSGEIQTTSWGPCEGSVGPSAEMCDGADNDCNGKVDEACKPTSMPMSCPQLGPASQNVMTNYPASVVFPMNCGPGGYVSSNYSQPDPGFSIEMHVVGVYEGLGGSVDVVVKPTPKPVVLVLSSYSSVLWTVTLSAGAALDSVILQGFEPQDVMGVPANVPVTKRGFNEACAYTYGWEDFNNQGGGDYKLMISSVRAFVGMNESTFQGCYSGGSFEVPF
jgi:hypothetical protein